MKTQRQKKIIELIENNDIETQEELAQALQDAGYNVTQATVSRDIRELKLTKTSTDGKHQKYVVFSPAEFKLSDKYVNVLKRETKKELVLLNDFLSSNKIILNKEIVDINLLLEDVMESFKPLIEKKNIKLISRIPKDELMLFIDYDKMCEVISNLIKNSIESIDKVGIIEIYSIKIKDNVNIIIKDNGIGMTKKEIKNIFIPFYTTKSKGTGLGTYISKIIIKKHRGKIKYESIKNKGTKTIVTLPINKKIMYN